MFFWLYQPYFYPAVIATIFIPTKELAMPIELPTNESKAGIW